MSLRPSQPYFERQKSQSSTRQCSRTCFTVATTHCSVFSGNAMSCCANSNNILGCMIKRCSCSYVYLSQVPYLVQTSWTSQRLTFCPCLPPSSHTLSGTTDMSLDVDALDCAGPFIPKMCVLWLNLVVCTIDTATTLCQCKHANRWSWLHTQ